MRQLALLLTACFLVLPLSVASAQDVLKTDEILKTLNDPQLTKAQTSEYHKSIWDRQAEGTGTVVDVLPGRSGKHRVTVLSSASSPDKGYNIVLYVQMDEPPPLQKGQKIKVKGKIGRMSGYRGVSIDVIGTYEELPR